MVIKLPYKIIVRSSPIHGLGVFAKEVIGQGEMIEECPCLFLPIPADNLFLDYRFGYPPQTNDLNKQQFALPMGYGCIYNHSDNNNATWFIDEQKQTYKFIAIRDIEAGEEICTSYGGEEYWAMRKHIKKK